MDNNPKSKSSIILRAIKHAAEKADTSAQKAQDQIQANFCPNCGHELQQDEHTETDSQE